MGELGKRLAVFSTSVVLTLLVAEGALRLLVPTSFWNPPFSPVWEWLVYDPVRGWKNQPGYSSEFFRIDSMGLRGAERPRRKPAGVVRIVSLGDSGTFGMWRPEAAALRWDSYAEILQEIATLQGYDGVEVVNAGVLGYGSSQGLRQLTLELLDLDPDVVTLRFGFNDHSTPLSPQHRLVEPESSMSRELFYAFSGSRLLQLAIVALRRTDALHPEPFTVPWTSPERFERDLERFAELAEREGFHLLFIDYPIRAAVRGESTGQPVAGQPRLGVESIEELHEIHQRYQRIVLRVASATQTPLLETSAACSATGGDCFSDYDLVHPTQVGAELIAGLLFERLSALGWLSPPSPTAASP